MARVCAPTCAKGWKFNKDEGWKPWFRSAIKRIFEHLDAEEEVALMLKTPVVQSPCIHPILRRVT